MTTMRRTDLARDPRGFTLVELMVTVAILAVLVSTAVVSYKIYMRRARIEEAKEFLYSIRMKQEEYFAIYSQYVDTNGGAEGSWFPNNKFGGEPNVWDWSELDCRNNPAATPGWCALGIRTDQNATYFQYVTIGWNPTKGSNPTGSAHPEAQPANFDTTRRWWYAVARGDLDANGTFSTFVLTSQLRTVVMKNETE